LSYFEAVNKDSLKNAFQRFEEEGIIQVRKDKTTRAPPTMRISPQWVGKRDPLTGKVIAEGALWEFIEHIAKFRREGYVLQILLCSGILLFDIDDN
jgi:hypothetical protein